MSTATRNRAIKKALQQAFAGMKVAVTGGRGTAHGWVTVSIDYAPRTWQEDNELRTQVRRLACAAAKAAGSSMSTYYSDDYSDQSAHLSMLIDFLPRRDFVDGAAITR
jgi:hypothetical protein